MDSLDGNANRLCVSTSFVYLIIFAENIHVTQRKFVACRIEKKNLHRKIKKMFNKFQKCPPSNKNKKLWTIPQLDRKRPLLETTTAADDSTALGRRTVTNLPSSTSKRGGATITNDNPFLEWWREFHNNINSDEVILNFSDKKSGFWGEFATIEERRGVNDEAVKQYLAVRDVETPQSLNALVKRYGWTVIKVKNGIFTWKSPAKLPPDQAMRKRSKRATN